MKVSEICRTEVATISEQASIAEAAQQMRDQAVGCLIITNQQHKAIGVITDRDITIKVTAVGKDINRSRVSEIMAKKLITLTRNQDLKDVAKIFSEHSIRRAPVVDSNNKLCGIVTLDDIISVITNELGGVSAIIKSQCKQREIMLSKQANKTSQKKTFETV